MPTTTQDAIVAAAGQSLATPKFLITDAGLAAASIAGTNPPGPYVPIVKWKVGAAYGYQPQRSDTGLNGTILAQGAPLTYAYVGDNTINIVCRISAADGPFDFGEVGLFMPNDVMFAKAVFEFPQTKWSSLGSNVGSTYTFNCLIKLEQSVAVFQISTDGAPPDIYTVELWSDLFPPSFMAEPLIPVIKVNEPNSLGAPSLVVQVNDSWYISSTSYFEYNTADGYSPLFPVVNSSATFVDIASSHFQPHDYTNTQYSTNRSFVIKTADGFFRSVSSVAVLNSTTTRLTLNPQPLESTIPIGAKIQIFRSDGRMNVPIFANQIVDGPKLATVGNPGLAYGSQGLYMPSPGVIAAQGLLHAPGQNTGRLLTGADNLNSLSFTSGIYYTNSGSSGFPANMPVAWDGQIFITTPAADAIIQVYYPLRNGGGDAVGTNGQPIFWRSWNGPSGVWTNWSSISSKNKLGSFSGLFQQKGFIDFGGLLLQWSMTPILGNDAIYTDNFAVPFPTTAFGIVGTQQFTGTSDHAQFSMAAQIINNSTFTVSVDENPGGGSAVFVIATGA